jgi:hypothetical protein
MKEEEVEELENEIRLLNIEISDLTLDLQDCIQRNRRER